MVRLDHIIVVVILSVPLAISWTSFLITEGGLLDFARGYIDNLPDFFAKLLTCSTCLSGQIALWSYPILMWSDYDLFTHIISVTCSMLSAAVVMRYLEA
jgi:hypothetical protein